MCHHCQHAKTLYTSALELLNDLESHAATADGMSGAVLHDWMAGIPLSPGADSHLQPEDASLGQAIEDLRRVSRRLARITSLVIGAHHYPQGSNALSAPRT
jgi:hypothetical protein